MWTSIFEHKRLLTKFFWKSLHLHTLTWVLIFDPFKIRPTSSSLSSASWCFTNMSTTTRELEDWKPGPRKINLVKLEYYTLKSLHNNKLQANANHFSFKRWKDKSRQCLTFLLLSHVFLSFHGHVGLQTESSFILLICKLSLFIPFYFSTCLFRVFFILWLIRCFARLFF